VRVDIDDMFDTMDTDANGEIDIDEFLCFYDIVILPSTIR
jgi:Ca2+-binding EF-hand superfamily protein